MAKLYDILKNNELSKYPPLPDWVKKSLEGLSKNPNSFEYFEFTQSIRFDLTTNKWTMSTNQ